MRVSRAQQAKNREQVVASAAKLLRERGIEGIGVDALAKAAGMTHGAIYSQFGSKEELAAARSVNRSTKSGSSGSRRRRRRCADLFNKLVRSYVSRSHRDNPGTGCALAAMGPDATRHGDAVRQAFGFEHRDDRRDGAGLPGRNRGRAARRSNCHHCRHARRCGALPRGSGSPAVGSHPVRGAQAAAQDGVIAPLLHKAWSCSSNGAIYRPFEPLKGRPGRWIR